MILFIYSLKFNFESIVISSSVTEETDFMVILQICNVSEPAFPRIINWNLSGFTLSELYTKLFIYILVVLCKVSEYVI